MVLGSVRRLLRRAACRAVLALAGSALLIAAGGAGAPAAGSLPAGLAASVRGGTASGTEVVTLHGQQFVVQPHGQYGVLPVRDQQATPPAAGRGPLRFGGGRDGIGVTTGHPEVFLVFWGSPWGTASTDPSGLVTFSHDPHGAAPYLQRFFRGLGTGSETWSGVMTQYCEGVASGATTCPASAAHVGYPTGGALAGVFTDIAAAVPQRASQSQMAAEAAVAAQHFGRTTPASNRNAQYVLVFPTGTNPAGFNAGGGFCAFHDFTTSRFGDLAYTNLPYVSDAGGGCGTNFVNPGAAGLLDPFSMAGGHEYAETITDQNPPGGWTTASGAENGDLCAYLRSGPGRVQNLVLTTGTFAVQGTWSNDDNACSVSHPIVGSGGGGGGVTVQSPGNQHTRFHARVSLQLHVTGGSGALQWSAIGLPTGLTIGATTGRITGRARARGTFSPTVTARDAAGNTGSATFTWTVA
jgi:hypothetical protein